MTDGAQFFASLAKQSALSSAPVTAFGFLGETHGRIDIQGRGDDLNLLRDLPHRVSASFVGGDMSIQGRTITAPAGQINLVSLQSGEVALSKDGPQLSPGYVLGTIRLTAKPFITAKNPPNVSVNTKVSDEPPGNIFIRSGQLMLEDAIIDAVNQTGDSNSHMSGGNIALVAESISASHSQIRSESYGANDAGFITLRGQDITLNNNTQVIATGSSFISLFTGELTNQGGRAGTVTIQGLNGPARNVTIQNATINATSTGGSRDNQPADVHISSQGVTLDHATINAQSTGVAPAGNIVIEGANNILLNNNSALSTVADNASGGNVTLSASNMVRLVNARVTTSVFGPENTQGGNITIDTVHPQFVILQGNSQLLAQAFQGRGGDITISGGVVLQEPGSVICIAQDFI
jgi:hypothetical protein